ncbi:MAG TPA: phage major capsid protein [Candidatus Sulfotelmatobacter sp.]|nr:phage major capsid protein [Candidatus Sulfotelmatobacter sp.]
MKTADLLAERHDLFVKAEALVHGARTSGTDLAGDNLVTFNGCIATMKDIDLKLDMLEKVSAGFERERSFPVLPMTRTNPGTRVGMPDNGNGPVIGRDADGNEVPIFGKGQSVEAYTRQHHEDYSEGGAVTLGGLVKAMCLGGGSPEIRNALSISTDSAGGLTVPVVILTQIIDALRARSCMFEAGARTLMLDTGKSTTIAAIASDPTAAWRAENADVAVSDMSFTPVSFTPKSLAVMVVASRELLEDSLNVNEALMLSLAKAFASELDRVGLIGAGTGSEPKGVSKVTGIGSYSMGTNGATLANYDPFVEALGILQAANANDPTAVIIAPRTAKQLSLLKDTLNQPLRRPTALENLPFLVTSKLPINEVQGGSSAASRAVMGYFPDVLFGIRSALSIEVLREKYADKLQYGILAHLRADVAVAHAANFCNIVGLT